MGNNTSSEESNEKFKASHQYHQRARYETRESKHYSRRHPPISHGAPPPPTATAIAPSSASTSTSNINVTRSPTNTHSRTRSRTSVTSSLRPEESASSQKSEGGMGNTESRESKDGRQVRPPSRSQTLPPSSTESEKPAPSPSSQPVDVPHVDGGFNEKEAFQPSGLPDESPFTVGTSNRYDRPPRLPLPIEEEPHTPGSPIISPIDLPLNQVESDGAIPRRTSVLSSTTVDDDDIADDMFSNEVQSLAPTVPTTLTWRGESDKVYVTGTFVNWARKFKLYPDKEHGGFSATVNLKPGTHHLKFLVRGDMTTSDELPTTVDYAGNFVNYIEVVAPPVTVTEQPTAPAEPMPIPGAALTAAQATAPGEPAARPMDIRTATRAPETATGMPSTLQETIGPDGTQSIAQGQLSDPLPNPTPQIQHQEHRRAAPPRHKVPRPRYTSEIPAFLLDLDNSNPNDERGQRAKRVEQNLPQPPTLPMFLGKSILNGQMPHNDDASVLLMPNHTVLNHLATSSIKHGVLATSGTTRYKRKFLTTIMYKPTSSDDG